MSTSNDLCMWRIWCGRDRYYWVLYLVCNIPSNVPNVIKTLAGNGLSFKAGILDCVLHTLLGEYIQRGDATPIVFYNTILRSFVINTAHKGCSVSRIAPAFEASCSAICTFATYRRAVRCGVLISISSSSLLGVDANVCSSLWKMDLITLGDH